MWVQTHLRGPDLNFCYATLNPVDVVSVTLWFSVTTHETQETSGHVTKKNVSGTPQPGTWGPRVTVCHCCGPSHPGNKDPKKKVKNFKKNFLRGIHSIFLGSLRTVFQGPRLLWIFTLDFSGSTNPGHVPP